jgi:hypothetical protein
VIKKNQEKIRMSVKQKKNSSLIQAVMKITEKTKIFTENLECSQWLQKLIPVLLESSQIKWLGEHISHIVGTSHKHKSQLIGLHPLPDKVVDHINVLRFAGALWIFDQ